MSYQTSTALLNSPAGLLGAAAEIAYRSDRFTSEAAATRPLAKRARRTRGSWFSRLSLRRAQPAPVRPAPAVWAASRPQRGGCPTPRGHAA